MLKSPAFSTSFLESRMIQKLKSRKSRIKPGLFAFLLAERIIFGKKTQKSQVSLVRYLTFSLVCGRIWQRGAPAGPPAVRVVGACSPVGCVQARLRRQARQVRPSIFAKLRRSRPPLPCSERPFPSALIRLQPLLPPPAPETHPVSPFLDDFGCVLFFSAVFWAQNFRASFCASCRIALTG